MEPARSDKLRLVYSTRPRQSNFYRNTVILNYLCIYSHAYLKAMPLVNTHFAIYGNYRRIQIKLQTSI